VYPTNNVFFKPKLVTGRSHSRSDKLITNISQIVLLHLHTPHIPPYMIVYKNLCAKMCIGSRPRKSDLLLSPTQIHCCSWSCPVYSRPKYSKCILFVSCFWFWWTEIQYKIQSTYLLRLILHNSASSANNRYTATGILWGNSGIPIIVT
jgi:hypothetical protein